MKSRNVCLFVVCLCLSSSGSTVNDDKSAEFELPPPIFPDDTTKYRIVPANETLLRILSENGDDAKRGSEIYDLLHSAQYANAQPISPFENGSANKTAHYVNFKLQSELLQENRGFVARDDLGRHLQEHAGHGHSIGGKIGYLTGSIAAIAIGTLVSVIAVAYGGVALWRKKYQIKYDARVPHDDDSMISDDRSFDII